jgi:iron complex outermembrane receptor protein
VLTSPAYTQAVDTAILRQFGVVAAFPAGFFRLPPKPFQTFNTTPASANLKDYGGSAKLEWSLPNVDITNIFAYRAQNTLYEQAFAHPITEDVPIVDNSKWYWYEELRAVSTTAGPWHFLAGGTYLHDHFHGKTTNLLFPPLYTVPIPAIQEATNTFTESTDTVRNWSIYGQVGYDFTDDLNLTVSGRYIHEINEALFTAPVVSTASIEANKFLPAATLSYKLPGGGNVYARFAKGFKAGGINPVVPPNFFPTNYGKVFGPEEVKTYEIGAKNTFFDRRVQASTAIFYNDYSGLQYETNGNTEHPALIEAIVNAGTAQTWGAEGSVTWRVIPSLTVSANAAYLEATYKNFKNTDGTVLALFDYSGLRMVYAPKWQLGFTADLDQPINDKFQVTANMLSAYTSNVIGQYSTVSVLDNARITPYWLTNLRVGLKTADSRYSVSLFVNNLFNQAYFSFASLSSVNTNGVWGDPRIIGGEVDVKFH